MADSDEESDDSCKVINSYRTPKKPEDNRRDYPNSGKSLEQLKTERKGPTNFIVEKNNYNTDRYDPEESDSSSIADFVASDNSVEESAESDDNDEEQTVDEENNSEFDEDEDPKSPDQINGDDDDDGVIKSSTKKKRSIAIINSDASSDDDDGAPIILSPRKRSRKSRVNLSQSTAASRSTAASQRLDKDEEVDERERSPPLAMLRLPSTLPAAQESNSSSNDGEPDDRIGRAPRKRRPSERKDDDDKSPLRRSQRISSSQYEAKYNASRALFDKYDKRRKEFLAKLAAKSSVEQPQELDEEEDEIINAEIEERQLQPIPTSTQPEEVHFHDIGMLADLNDGAVINVRGKVVWYGDEDSRPIRTGSEYRVPIRKFLIRDKTGSVYVTLWGDYANNKIVDLHVSICLKGVRKTSYNGKPQLSTVPFGKTAISEYLQPPDVASASIESNTMAVADENSNATPTSRFVYTIKQADPWKTYVYNACAKCSFAKCLEISTRSSHYRCNKCGKVYDIADTDIGITMRIEVEDQDELMTIFTQSVRTLCPSLPTKWGQHDEPAYVAKDHYKELVLDAMQAILPRRVSCSENDVGILTIRNLL